MKHEHLEEAGGLSFGAFFARWMRFRREDMLAMLSFPVGFWLLLLAVVLIAGAVEGTADPEALGIPVALALVGGVFAGFIVGVGSAGVCFTLAVCWGQPRRYGVAALWLSGILYGALNLLLAAVLQGAVRLFAPGSLDLFGRLPLVLWLALLIGPTAASVVVKAVLRRFGPKAGGWLYLVFMIFCIGIPNLDNVRGMDLRPALFAVLAVGLVAAGAVGSRWLLRTPVGND